MPTNGKALDLERFYLHIFKNNNIIIRPKIIQVHGRSK